MTKTKFETEVTRILGVAGAIVRVSNYRASEFVSVHVALPAPSTCEPRRDGRRHVRLDDTLTYVLRGADATPAKAIDAAYWRFAALYGVAS